MFCASGWQKGLTIGMAGTWDSKVQLKYEKCRLELSMSCNFNRFDSFSIPLDCIDLIMFFARLVNIEVTYMYVDSFFLLPPGLV